MEPYLQRLRQARERKPDYREVLDLAERMLIEKCRVKDQSIDSSIALDRTKARRRLEEGLPYLGPDRPGLPTGPLKEAFSCLLKSFRELNPSRHESLQKALTAKDFVLERVWGRLLANELSETNLEAELGAEGSLLFFFLVQSLKPVLENLAEQWRSAVKDFRWEQGFCPFCGASAGMGEIRQEGRRFLHCPLCGTEWEYPRMKCPYCRNEDQERLTYFQVEGEPEGRVDICGVCRNYWKTVDSRGMEGPLDFEVEDYLTLHLDHLAQEEGYLRPEKLFVDLEK
ncbi:MAG: formate dehydrogenase accessory protein FdhE [Syntrophaceae bacterium]|nr:formate dehydrogenase accessory protein FdhE [Syntrophaceae bacterium]